MAKDILYCNVDFQGSMLLSVIYKTSIVRRVSNATLGNYSTSPLKFYHTIVYFDPRSLHLWNMLDK